jgi:hypothetical protein
VDLEAELTECRAFEAERASLAAAGIPADMAQGPEWASANLSPDRLQQIKRFIHVEEQLKFHCPEVFATAAVKAEEERARQQAHEAKLWAEKLAQSAKNPLLPEPKPTELARAKPRSGNDPPLPERATR